MRGVVLISLICAVSAIKMSPEDMEMQKLIWENTNVVEGDILELPTTERLAASSYARKWPNKEIAFSVDNSLSFMRGTIDKAIWHIQNNTCLRFRETQTDPQRVLLIYTYGVCNSYVGKMGFKQPLRLDEACNDVGSITHELLHAAGFIHEHMRSDRDNYIQVNWQNINQKDWKNFIKVWPRENTLLNTFDYDSIMIYGEYNGANKARVKAMESINPGFVIKSPDEKPGMSQGDIDKVKEFYNC